MTLEERNAKLEEAKQLVLKGWCQGTCARDVEGVSVPLTSEKAVCFCVIGAILKVNGWPRTSVPKIEELIPLYLVNSPGEWNDEPGRTVEEVAALFDRAKELPL